jgi:hypothetical protein
VHVVTTVHPETMAKYDRLVGVGTLVAVDTAVTVNVDAVAGAARRCHLRNQRNPGYTWLVHAVPELTRRHGRSAEPRYAVSRAARQRPTSGFGKPRPDTHPAHAGLPQGQSGLSSRRLDATGPAVHLGWTSAAMPAARWAAALPPADQT